MTPSQSESERLRRSSHDDLFDPPAASYFAGMRTNAPPDDEEGRFFGGGISQLEADILDYIDDRSNHENDTVIEPIDLTWLKKTALNFHRCISQNSELRAKFVDTPEKFIASEVNLDEEIKALSILSEYPQLYIDFVRLGSAADLVGLLTHDNTDIAIDALEIMCELTDDDAAANDEQWNSLVGALTKADFVDLLVSNFSRLDEMIERDRNGVYYGLGIMENLCSKKSLCEHLGQHGPLLEWLLKRIRRPEDTVSQNKQYSTEILAILAQTSTKTRSKLVELDATDTLLQLAAPYRKSDPERGTHEEEFMENLFEILACLVDDAEGKARFIDAEGVELCLIMLRTSKMSRQPALRLLDHATGGVHGVRVCQKLVEEGGLKAIFTIFMKRNDNRTIQHLLSIFVSMFRLLPRDSAERIRTLAKFVERDYEKITKLLKHRAYYTSRVLEEEKRIEEAGGRIAGESESVVRSLVSEMFPLQMLNIVLAWLSIEDDNARIRIQESLEALGSDFGSIIRSLQEQLKGLDLESEETNAMQDMLAALVDYFS